MTQCYPVPIAPAHPVFLDFNAIRIPGDLNATRCFIFFLWIFIEHKFPYPVHVFEQQPSVFINRFNICVGFQVAGYGDFQWSYFFCRNNIDFVVFYDTVLRFHEYGRVSFIPVQHPDPIPRYLYPVATKDIDCVFQSQYPVGGYFYFF